MYFNVIFYILYELAVWFIILFVLISLLFLYRKKLKLLKKIPNSLKVLSIGLGIFLIVSFFVLNPEGRFLEMPVYMHSHTADNKPASVPLVSAFTFLLKSGRFEQVEDIGHDPNDVPAPIERTNSENIHIDIVAQEVIGQVANGSYFNYWTYDKKVPGPMYRVRVGDTISISLTNHPTSLHDHNIDLHAVTGPGGGATLTHVAPGETKSFSWKALNPGLYVYHCAMPNVSTHNSHGQYGLILVEPEEGLPKVDKEFYVMQGELYTLGGAGKKGLTIFDSKGLIDGHPTYVTFNGKVESMPRMKARVGERIRMYVGNGGVNLISSFHIIGEIFDVVYPEAAIGSEPHKNIQTTTIPAGGAAIVEFSLDVPGKYILVDHALARLNKGAWAILEVEGPENSEIFQSLDDHPHTE